VVLDKTGTVTTGAMSVVAVTTAGGCDSDEALRLAGAVEDGSEHPVGQAIARAASARFGALAPAADFAGIAGAGAQGVAEGEAVVVGSPRLLRERSLSIPADLAGAVDAAESAGRTAVLVGWGGSARAAISVADAVKPTSAEAVLRLRALGLRPVLLTGDNSRTALAVAGQLGIPADDVFAEISP